MRARQIAGRSLVGYPDSVRRLFSSAGPVAVTVGAALVVLLASGRAQATPLSTALGTLARSGAKLTAPAPKARIAVEAEPPQSGAPGDVTKIAALAPDKLPLRPKIKACCGYPISLKEGFRLSFYWLAYESEYAGLDYDTAIYTPQGFFIGRFPSAFVYELKLEGSGILLDGRVLNYAGECNYGMGTCFRTLDPKQDPLGAGVQGRRLQAFRSIAVDPRLIPIGATVYIPELAGIHMPDGTIHDGCLRADDQGGAIKNAKIDFFVESYLNFKEIGDNLWWHLKATPILDEPRCAYLRTDELRTETNEQTDWVMAHKRRVPMRRAEKLALRKIKRNRAIANAWMKRHYHLGSKRGAKIARGK